MLKICPLSFRATAFSCLHRPFFGIKRFESTSAAAAAVDGDVLEISALPSVKDAKNRDHNGMREKTKKGWTWNRPAAVPVSDAISLLSKAHRTKFVESIDLAVNLNIDVRKSDQNMRGSIALKHAVGKQVRVAVFATGVKAEEAQKAGASIVGGEDLVEKVKGGFLDFDRCIATPDMMPVVGKVARILGPRGLMPNPKMGTITNDVAGFIRSSSAGVPYRADKGGTVHARVGRGDHDAKHIEENVLAFINGLREARPKGVKDPFIKSAYLSSSMGPGVPLILTAERAAAKRS